MVDVNLISDILEIICGIPFMCYYIFIMFLARTYRELEFNRMWRTRTMLTLCAFIYTVVYIVANIRMLTEIYPSKAASIICASYGCVHSGIFLSIFIIMVTILIKLATSVTALDTGKPNKQVINKALLYSIITILLTAADIVINIFKIDLPVFETHSASENTCFNSTLQSSVVLILVIICFIVIIKIRDDSDYLGLNRNHKRIVGRFGITLVSFFIAGLISEVSPWVKGWIRVFSQLFTGLFNQISLTICIYFLVHKPINDAREAPLHRGTITLRHQQFNSSHEVISNDIESA